MLELVLLIRLPFFLRAYHSLRVFPAFFVNYNTFYHPRATLRLSGTNFRSSPKQFLVVIDS